jgi:hypothetical protein
MVLHCAGRLGVLSYIYRSKAEIGHWLGMIKERPITVCDSHYFFDRDLKISTDTEDEQPLTVTQAQEIILYFNAVKPITIQPSVVLIPSTNEIHCTLNIQLPHLADIFHPPAIA